ncbi:hypothetical protein T552_01981 [Pneumocystis carinii B80]|uniref:C3H1-type domain-containing protein n=1 Tax=Pneumocystis carinii (strain B80) TaxID=1408658 RepID=A0A0W4ZIC4_PNEC8|nr:hypothetical protein T552_01981 [Pneumocystis carinii B80]KTW28121.1 hypothetical protein T552_01981 [Pneumocystis carinii B80]
MQLLSTNGTFSKWSTLWDEGWFTVSSRCEHPWMDVPQEKFRDILNKPLKHSYGSQISSSSSSEVLFEESFSFVESKQRAKVLSLKGVSPWLEYDSYNSESINARDVFSSRMLDGVNNLTSIRNENNMGALTSPFSNLSKELNIPTQHKYPTKHQELQTNSAGSSLQKYFCNETNEPSLDAVHSKKSPESSIKTDLYKTELCRNWEENRECRYGLKCQFAHGYSELRNLLRHPKYKTSPCKTFMEIGFCPYGQRCCFSHVKDSIKPKKLDISQPFEKTSFQSSLLLPQLSNSSNLKKHEKSLSLKPPLQIVTDNYISGFTHSFNDITLLDEISPFTLG